VHTIFPFWISRPPGFRAANLPLSSCDLKPGCGYAELPYTLPQDSTLFLLLGEKDTGTWKRKLDWIAQCGGMALMNVHPDYMSFRESCKSGFSAALYEDFLRFITDSYNGCAHSMLPREAAHFVKSFATEARSRSVAENPL
jgi:hypothetical protein